MEIQAENIGGIDDEVLMRLVLEKFSDKNGEPNVRALSEAAELGYDTVYSIVVRKKLNPSTKTLKQLAKALDCSVDYLLGNTKYRHLPIEELPDIVRQMTRVAVTLPSMRQSDLLMLAETYAENIEETQRQVLRDMRNLIVHGAYATGRREELDRLVVQLYEELRKSHEPADPDNDEHDQDDRVGAEVPLEK